MASRAERARRKKAALIQAARDAAPAAAPGSSAARLRASATVTPMPRRLNGVDMLHARGRLTAQQAWAGRLYGMLERTAQIGDAASIRSCLADPDGGGGGGYLMPDGGDRMFTAAWIADCRGRLLQARAALAFHTEKIAVVDLICARGLHPRDISRVQREAEQIETVLAVALDDLVLHFRRERVAPGA